MSDELIKMQHELNESAISATHIIAKAAEEASHVIVGAASDAARLFNSKGAEDHDLLIKLNTLMDSLKTDIKDLKDGTSTKISDHDKRISALEQSKSNFINIDLYDMQHEKLEDKVSALQKILFVGIGIALVIELLVGIFRIKFLN